MKTHTKKDCKACKLTAREIKALESGPTGLEGCRDYSILEESIHDKIERRLRKENE